MDDRELEADAIVLLRPALRSAAESPSSHANSNSPCSTEGHGRSQCHSLRDSAADTRIWLQEQRDDICARSEGDTQRPKRTKSIQRVIRETAHSHTSGGTLLGTNLHTRRRALQVLCIENGTVEKENLAASQLLQIVRNSAPAHERGQSGGLKLRDIRQISNTAVGSQRPAIEPRRGCVVINMPSAVKALILADKVILLASDNGSTDLPQASIRREASSHVLDRLTQIARPLVGSAVDMVLPPPPPPNPLIEPLLEEGPPTIRLRHGSVTVPKVPALRLTSVSHPRVTTPITVKQREGEHVGSFNVDDEFDEDAQSSDDSLACGALVRKLVRLSAMEDAGPFEFLALECILFEVIRKLSDETYPACEIATHTKTAALNSICTTSKLHQIRELKKILQDGATKAEGISQSLTEVLGSEEDIRRLELSRFRDHPDEWDDPSASHGAEDVEILLESYQQDIQGLVQQIENADETLDLTIQMMQLQLATTRTMLLKIEIALQVVGVIVGFVSAVAGIFGMNIQNGYEDRKNIFWSLACGMLALILFSVVSTGWVAGNLNL